MKIISSVLLLILWSTLNLVHAIDQTQTGFYYPTGTQNIGPYAKWFASGCDKKTEYFTDQYHIGWDIKATENDPVYAISNGTLFYTSLNGWGDGNIGLFYTHELSDGTKFLALYAHVRLPDNNKPPKKIYAGKEFAKVGPWPFGIHLHFGIRPRTAWPPTHKAELGKMPCSKWSDKNGFEDPIDWITQKVPGNPDTPDSSISAIDTALIIDSSGSMSWNDPYDNRLEAARFFIDLANKDDYISVIDFDSSTRVWAPIQKVGGNQDNLKNAVNRVDSSGGTNIGAGLTAGYNQLNSSPTPNSKIAVLLTDGQGSYSGEGWNYVNRGWKIFTIGLSNDVDRNLLENIIAVPTGGKYYGVSTQDAAKTAIQKIYQEIRQLTHGDIILHDENLLIFLAQLIERTVYVPQSAIQLIVTRLILGSDVEMSLIQPDGTVIDRQTSNPGVSHVLGSTYEAYKVEYPMTGTWKVVLEGTDVPQTGEETNLTVSITSGAKVGDLNGDGTKDMGDYYTFIAAFGSCEGNPKYDPYSDYDGDGCITFVDYQIWYKMYKNQ